MFSNVINSNLDQNTICLPNTITYCKIVASTTSTTLPPIPTPTTPAVDTTLPPLPTDPPVVTTLGKSYKMYKLKQIL